jgi:hypothetical protein
MEHIYPVTGSIGYSSAVEILPISLALGPHRFQDAHDIGIRWRQW